MPRGTTTDNNSNSNDTAIIADAACTLATNNPECGITAFARKHPGNFDNSSSSNTVV